MISSLFLVAATAHAQTQSQAPLHDAQTIQAQCDRILEQLRSRKAAMEAHAQPQGVLTEWNALSALNEDWLNPVYLLANVSPDKAVRDAAEACVVKFSPFNTELFQSEALYRRVMKSSSGDAIDRELRKDLLEGFEDSGVTLPLEKRARVKAINERMEAIEQAFSRNLRDDATRVAFTAEEMNGLPESYLKDKPRDEQGRYLLDLRTPSFVPYLQLATSEAGRKRYWIAKQNEGGDANLALLDEITALRQELASLYDLPDFATFQLRRRMAGTPAAVGAFLDQVENAVTPLQRRYLEELRALKAKTTTQPLESTRLERWDVAFYQESLRKSLYSVDQEALRRYFPTEKSVQFAMELAQRLYSIRFVKRDVPVWHADVRYYDVFDADTNGRRGRFLGGVYLDLFPRDGKYNHAAAFPIRRGSTRLQRTPISALVTNFNREGLNHNELETLLHEFGHVLHNLLSTTRYVDHAGTSVKRDFVEAPSQMFEEWARREPALALFAKVCPECPRLSSDQIAKLDAARKFGRANDYANQWLYASFDMALAQASPKSALDTWIDLQSKTPLGYVEGTKFPAGFGHIVGGYAAGYYGYMWSEVLALDMLSAFEGRMLDPKVGHRYRETILSRGGERPPADLVRAFLKRKPSPQAFFKEITGTRP
ncbi:MAG TPA: M3 family metallopeptidase [Burkholderiaceae bacterium]|nr:M3 family metallopeptidase [Burkholderiaceae bacterium]